MILTKWSGDEFRKIQEARKKMQQQIEWFTQAEEQVRKRLGDMPDAKPRPSTEGMTRITGRGTGSRKE